MSALATPDLATVELPVALTWHGNVPLVTFARVPIGSLGLPFWDDTIAMRTHIAGFKPLDDLREDEGDLAIAGAVHHMSRCGSTLVMRQFATLPRVAVLSEPFVFQHLLEGPPGFPDGPTPSRTVTRRRIRLLAAAHRKGLAVVSDRLVIKWPGLCNHHASTIADALPEVPTIFLHRDPAAVLASIGRASLGGRQHLRSRHMPDGFDRAKGAAAHDPLDMWAATIAMGCLGVLEVPSIRAVDYADLPNMTWTHIAPYFGFDLTANETALMEDAARFYSKDPTGQRVFSARERADHDAAHPRLAAIAAEFLLPALAATLRVIAPLKAAQVLAP